MTIEVQGHAARPSYALRPEIFFGPRLVYTKTHGREMSSGIEDYDEQQFANGQSCRDLKLGSLVRELETPLVESVDRSGDSFYFVGILRRQINRQSTEV